VVWWLRTSEQERLKAASQKIYIKGVTVEEDKDKNKNTEQAQSKRGID
jgi:hypothetical protein